MDQIHAKNTMPLKKRMLGLHGIMASSHQLIHKHHTKKSDPQTSMQLKKTGGFWFVDRYNGQCFADVKTATQKKKKVAEVRQSPAIYFLSVGQIVQLFLICSSITVLYGHVTRTLYIYI